MSHVFKTMTIVHVFSGTIALICGLIIVFATKGTDKHRRIGKTYFFTMLINAVLGILLALFSRVDYGYVMIFAYIIALMTSAVFDLVKKRSTALRLNALFVGVALAGVVFSQSIIAASATEVPISAFVVFSVITLLTFCTGFFASRLPAHAIKINMSLIVAFFAMANNSLIYGWYTKSINVYTFVIFAAVVIPLHVTKALRSIDA